MARIIQFYVPAHFQRKNMLPPPEERGKLIKFSVRTPKPIYAVRMVGK